MGKVMVIDVLLKNNDDVVLSRQGFLPTEKIRQVKLDMVADTGAGVVGLPKSIIEHLGLPQSRHVTLTLADGSQRTVPLYTDLKIEIMDPFGMIREGVFDCLGKPEDAPCILGQIVFEVMDFVVDCPNNQLIPNPAAPPGMMLYDDFSCRA